MLALITHSLLDYLTIYGTQLFMPFRDWPGSLGSIFIIDLLYTVPLLIGVAGSLFFSRTNPTRRLWNSVGLTLSTLYLVWGISAKYTAEAKFAASLKIAFSPHPPP